MYTLKEDLTKDACLIVVSNNNDDTHFYSVCKIENKPISYVEILGLSSGVEIDADVNEVYSKVKIETYPLAFESPSKDKQIDHINFRNDSLVIICGKTNYKTMFFIGESALGFIQKFKFKITADDGIQIEYEFPNQETFTNCTENTKERIKENMSRLKNWIENCKFGNKFCKKTLSGNLTNAITGL